MASAFSRSLYQLVEALPAAVYTTDATGQNTPYNEAAVTLWGGCPEPGKGEVRGFWKVYWPDGTPLPHEDSPMAAAIFNVPNWTARSSSFGKSAAARMSTNR